jgi:hypothetical protein
MRNALKLYFDYFLGKPLESEASASNPGLYLPPMEAAPEAQTPEARKCFGA